MENGKSKTIWKGSQIYTQIWLFDYNGVGIIGWDILNLCFIGIFLKTYFKVLFLWFYRSNFLCSLAC